MENKNKLEDLISVYNSNVRNEDKVELIVSDIK
jgi:hypothetical protein